MNAIIGIFISTCIISCYSENSDGLELKLGVLADTQRVGSWQSLLNQGSAINIAYDALVRDGVLPENVTFRIITRHTRREKEGLGYVVELAVDEQVNLIVGLPSSRVTEVISYLTSYMNLPHMTWAGQSYELKDKDLYTTLVRSAGPITDVSFAMINFFRQFGWQNMAIFNLGETLCSFSARAMRETFPNFNISIRQNIDHPEDLPITRNQLVEYINLLKQNSRIIFVCTETDDDDPLKELRYVFIEFCRNGMCNGDYIFIYTDKEPLDYDVFFRGDDDDDIVREAVKYLLMSWTSVLLPNIKDYASVEIFNISKKTKGYFAFSIARYTGEEGKQALAQFEIDVIERMSDMPWNSTEAKEQGETPGEDAQFLYDGIYLYGLWVNSTLNHENRSEILKDGEAFLEFSKNVIFQGVTGLCIMGDNADRIPDFRVDQYHDDGLIYPAATVQTKFEVIHIEDSLIWYTKDGKPPKDVPECGFTNDLCVVVSAESNLNSGIVATSISIVAVLALAGAGFLIRKKQISRVMLQSIWKISVNDIEILKSKVTMRSGFSSGSVSKASSVSLSCRIDANITTTGMFKGQRVVIRSLPNAPVNLTNEDLAVLKTMREMIHDNLNTFVGASFETATPCAVFQYCQKGALQDILEHDEIQLDTKFKYSLTYDLVQGIRYIHESKLGAHGRLKSSNCLVDNRWVLKITDYGLNRFANRRDAVKVEGENERYKSMLWTAPELLNDDLKSYYGTKAGDVYSFGIILHEIFYRRGPFAGNSKMTFRDIVMHVRNRESPPCRPTIFDDHGENNDTILPVILKLMSMCWSDREEDRPTVQVIWSYVKKNVKEIGRNIMDIVLKRLEKYASNLEYLVDQRTQELFQEKQKTDKLLYRMLPRSCADRLKLGEVVYPEVFESATVYFSDIVGFTVLSAKSTPMQVVDLLNDLYTCFDNVIDKYDAYKVETIGDAYLVVSGVPQRNGKRHAGEIADMSLEIREEVRSFKIPHIPDENLKARIGIHTGSCCAGVVGLSMPRYCLFGDTINTASRMESHGESMMIHISESTYKALHELAGFVMSFRGEMEIKGKGLMRTYWLDGKEHW